MSLSHRVRSCSFVLVALALATSCGPEGSALDAAPDAAPPATIPTHPGGRFAVTSTLDLPIPPAADQVITSLIAATDGPDDPSRYIVDRMIATLPDGTLKTIATAAAPYAAAYLNERLIEIAPRFVAGIDAIASGLARIAAHADTIETLQIDDAGAAVRTITAARFQVGSAPITVSLADAGLADIVIGTHVVFDATGHLTLGDHEHGWPYGALLRQGLERAVIASIEPTARDLATALGALVDCDRLGALLANHLGFGTATLYGTACRTGLTAIASEIYTWLAAIDDLPLALEVTGSADGVDLDGDGTMDELRAGRWSGSFHAAGWHVAIGAASFSGTKTR